MLARRYDDRRPLWWQIPDWHKPTPYDAGALMAIIDELPRRLRNEINERGLEQDVYDRLPYEFQIRIGEVMSPGSTDAEFADVWD